MASGEAVVSRSVGRFLQSGTSERARVWVYFRDHGEHSPTESAGAADAPPLAPRSIERRLRRAGSIIDEHDLAVNIPYIRTLAAAGCEVRHASRYLNAVSVEAGRDEIEAIRALDFVARIDRVATYHRSYPRAGGGGTLGAAADAYGPSRRQLEQIDVIPLHDDGYHGEGVLIAVLDTGFNYAREAFDSLEVVAEWDFIFDDSVTSDEAEDNALTLSQESHGTNVLSVLAGYAPGKLVGPAWKAGVVLAKTERTFEEVQGEEDDFVRALEWADSIGVDIVTASLGYFDWYDYEDIDGNTAVTTVACDIAASKGITVVISAGNQDGLPWPGITPPADGDSVIAVGAVDSLGVVTDFSSRGPTYDGRVKPDVMAMGEDVLVASSFADSAYFPADGTSFAAPLAAGACALLLQMHPTWGPSEVLSALRSEASRSAAPGNTYGWGVIDAYESAIHGATGQLASVEVVAKSAPVGVAVEVRQLGSETVTVDVVRREQTGVSEWGAQSTVGASIALEGGGAAVVWDTVGAGSYEYRAQLSSDATQASRWSAVSIAHVFTLHQSRPNPFVAGSGEVKIGFSIPGPKPDLVVGGARGEQAELAIYDVRGALVRRLFSQPLPPGDYEYRWDGRNEAGNPVGSGVYFYRMWVGSRSQSRKLVLVR
jgi:serine protease AprX